jgi:hypothetical protein
MGNKVRSTEERLKRLAVQAYKGYTPFKLKEKIVEDDVTITQEKLPAWKIPTLSKGKSRG